MACKPDSVRGCPLDDHSSRPAVAGGLAIIIVSRSKPERLADDEHFAYVAAWEWRGEGQEPCLHREPLTFENVHLTTRSYK